jgi:hypothetical protein
LLHLFQCWWYHCTITSTSEDYTVPCRTYHYRIIEWHDVLLQRSQSHKWTRRCHRPGQVVVHTRATCLMKWFILLMFFIFHEAKLQWQQRLIESFSKWKYVNRFNCELCPTRQVDQGEYKHALLSGCLGVGLDASQG